MISASFSAVSGVVSAGLSTTVFPVASAGAIFHAAISSGKFHGMICPATPSGVGLLAGKRVFEFVRPAGVVEEMRGGQRHIDIARFADRLAAVHRFDDRQLARAILNHPRDAVDVFAAFLRRHLRPDSFVRARARLSPRDRHLPRSLTRPRAIFFSFAGLIVSKYSPFAGGTNLPVDEQVVSILQLHMPALSGAGA